MPREILEIPFLGLDTKSDAKYVVPGKLLVAEDARFVKAREIRKRNGYLPLPQAPVGSLTPIPSAQRLAAFEQELLLIGGGSELYSFANSQAGWLDKGAVSAAQIVKARPLVSNTFQQSYPDAATAGGLTLYAWADGRGGVWGAVMDEASGAFVVPETQLNASASNARCVSIGLNLVVLYIETIGGTAKVKSRAVTPGAPLTFTAENILAVDATPTLANQTLDVALSIKVGTAAFAYNGNGNNVKVGYILPSGVIGGPANGLANIVSIAWAPAGPQFGIAVAPRANGEIWVLGVDANFLQYVILYQDLTTRAALAALDNAITSSMVTAAFDSTDTCRVAYQQGYNASPNTNHSIFTASITGVGNVASGKTELKKSIGLFSKLFFHPTGTYFIGVYDPTSNGKNGLQHSYWLINWSTGKICARIQPGTGGLATYYQVPTLVQLTPDTFFIAFPVRQRFVAASGVTYSLFSLWREDFSLAGGSFRTGQLGSTLMLSGGGVMQSYDGAGNVTELGMLLFPENVTVAMGGGGSGTLEAGVRSACFVLTWYDQKGQLHRSAPSVPIQFTAAANDKATFTVPNLNLTDRVSPRTKVTLECYCTIVGGPTYFQVPNSPNTDPVAFPVYVDPTGQTTTFVRAIADANIQTNKPVYTQGTTGATGGELEADAAQAPAFLAIGRNRAYLVPAENRRRIYFTKLRALGVAPEWNDTLYFDLSPDGGDATAIFLLDEKLIIFKARQIEVVMGDGPDNTSLNSTLSPPALITTDVGSSVPDSICLTPRGLVFMSDKGIYLLDRSLAVSYKGAAVEKYNGFTVTSAVLVEGANEVRFTFKESNDAGARMLTWNYFFDEWSEATYSSAIHGALWFQTANHVYATAKGQVFQENPATPGPYVVGTYVDGPRRVGMHLKTAWIKLDLQGYVRFRSATLIGNFFTNHKLRIRIAYDYEDFTQIIPNLWDTATTINTGAPFGEPSGQPFGEPSGQPFGGKLPDAVYQVKIGLARQKCQAIRFEIDDLGPQPGAAFSLNAISLEVMKKSGTFRVPATKVVG